MRRTLGDVTRGQQIRDVARTLKYADALTSMRTLEKFEIERLYYSASHRLGIVKSETSHVLAKMWSSSPAAGEFLCALTEVEVRRVGRTLKRRFSKEQPYVISPHGVTTLFGFTDGTSLRVVRHMVANRQLP